MQLEGRNKDGMECSRVDALLVEYVRAVKELSLPKQAIKNLHDSKRLTFYSKNIQDAIKRKPGSLSIAITMAIKFFLGMQLVIYFTTDI